jgi:hypothetical protein
VDVERTMVSKYMAERRRPPSQGWRTFLRHHADAVVSIDMFVAPMLSFWLLYGLLVLRHSRRETSMVGCKRIRVRNGSPVKSPTPLAGASQYDISFVIAIARAAMRLFDGSDR